MQRMRKGGFEMRQEKLEEYLQGLNKFAAALILNFKIDGVYRQFFVIYVI